MTKEKQRINAEEVVSNLSDFALFLTVMKNREAYRNTLSIIMDEPEIEIEQVKVEEVILAASQIRETYQIQGFAIYNDYFYYAGRYFSKGFSQIHIYRAMRRSGRTETG